jgi:hypothetical protein
MPTELLVWAKVAQGTARPVRATAVRAMDVLIKGISAIPREHG